MQGSRLMDLRGNEGGKYEGGGCMVDLREEVGGEKLPREQHIVAMGTSSPIGVVNRREDFPR